MDQAGQLATGKSRLQRNCRFSGNGQEQKNALLAETNRTHLDSLMKPVKKFGVRARVN
jgi:hypothetical protein